MVDRLALLERIADNVLDLSLQGWIDVSREIPLFQTTTEVSFLEIRYTVPYCYYIRDISIL